MEESLGLLMCASYISILPKSDIYNVCSVRILSTSDIYSAMAMPTDLVSDCNVITKITKRFKENIVDNESVGTLHMPNPKLHSVLACMCSCFSQ